MGSWFSTPWDPSTGIADLTGKVAIVTGANAGLGYVTAYELARHGAKVYVAARSEAKAFAAIELMYAEGPEIKAGNLIWLPLDLIDFDSIVKAAEAFLQKEERLDILVNNAGVATKSFQTTPAGFEVAMGVNHLAHFLLTLNLLPIINRTAEQRGSDVRIINVSSSVHTMMIPLTMRFDKPSDLKYTGPSASPPHASTKDLFARYGLSKLANVLFTTSLQRRYPEITATSCNPGPTSTAGGMSVWPEVLRPVMSRLFPPAAAGARVILFLAGGLEAGGGGKGLDGESREGVKGRYFGKNCKVQEPSKVAQDDEIAENLWTISEGAVEKWIQK